MYPHSCTPVHPCEMLDSLYVGSMTYKGVTFVITSEFGEDSVMTIPTPVTRDEIIQFAKVKQGSHFNHYNGMRSIDKLHPLWAFKSLLVNSHLNFMSAGQFTGGGVGGSSCCES